MCPLVDRFCTQRFSVGPRLKDRKHTSTLFGVMAEVSGFEASMCTCAKPCDWNATWPMLMSPNSENFGHILRTVHSVRPMLTDYNTGSQCDADSHCSSYLAVTVQIT